MKPPVSRLDESSQTFQHACDVKPVRPVDVVYILIESTCNSVCCTGKRNVALSAVVIGGVVIDGEKHHQQTSLWLDSTSQTGPDCDSSQIS